MKENVLKDKSFAFAVRMMHVFRHLQQVKKEYIVTKQLLRSATAVGALVREAEYAESKNDFIHKLAIAQKEANETIYWLDLLAAADYLSPNEAASLLFDATELLKLLTSSIKTTKKNND